MSRRRWQIFVAVTVVVVTPSAPVLPLTMPPEFTAPSMAIVLPPGATADQPGRRLADYLSEHARRENYVLLTPPRVQLETDDDLDVGVFGIATRMVQSSAKSAGAPDGDAEPNQTMIYKPSAAPVPQATEAASPVDLGIQREIAVLTWNGERHEVSKRRVVLGRSKDADLQVPDPNASRRHAELRQEGATYWLIDLDSTNGVEVRGKRVKRLKLEDGTRFTIGSTEIALGA